MEEFFKKHNSDCCVATGYGMTELAACSTSEMITAKRPGSVGIPLCQVNVKVCDTETGVELKYGEVGELLVSSPCAMNGYFNNVQETEKAFQIDDNGDKWIRTGDLGKIDEDGFVYIIGRIKRIEITLDPENDSPIKLYPDYIEKLLLEIDGIDDCAVIAVEHRIRVHVPVAFVKISKNTQYDIGFIKERMIEKTELYNRPIEYISVVDFPLLKNGKIDYVKLKNIWDLEYQNN